MLKMVNYPNFEHTITPHFLKLPFRRREAFFILTYFHVSKLDIVLLNPILLFYCLRICEADQEIVMLFVS